MLYDFADSSTCEAAMGGDVLILVLGRGERRRDLAAACGMRQQPPRTLYTLPPWNKNTWHKNTHSREGSRSWAKKRDSHEPRKVQEAPGRAPEAPGGTYLGGKIENRAEAADSKRG